MPIDRLKDFLDYQGVKYVTLPHAPAYTTGETASAAGVPAKTIAKAVMIFVDGRLVMAVVPGNMHVDLARLRHLTAGKHVAVASESEFRQFFPDCETGAMPPFGMLYNVPVFVDELLATDDIVFNAGSHHELMMMSYSDYLRVVQPVVGRFAAPPHRFWARAS